MDVEIGDSISADGRAGEVVGFDDGRAIVRPFPIAEQQDWPGPPACFVAQGEVAIIKKHFERTTIADIELQRLAARAQATRDAMSAAHYEAAARVDRTWYRERER